MSDSNDHAPLTPLTNRPINRTFITHRKTPSISAANNATAFNHGGESFLKPEITNIIPIETGRAGVHIAMRIRGQLEVTSEMNGLSSHIFQSTTTSETQLHQQVITPLIQSAFKGFNSNIVTHGASQTGKSSAMWGPLTQVEDSENDASGDQENRGSDAKANKEEGIISFALEQIFTIAKKEEKSTIAYAFGLSVFAINPNDQLIDCLATSSGSVTQTPKLQEDGASRLQITNATKKVVQSKNHALRILASVLSSAEHKKNHMIVTVTIEKKESDKITSSQLQCIDLTGTGSANDADETSARRSFNPSLNVLDKVVSILSKSSPDSSSATSSTPQQPASSPRHIPFRESKLTRLLKDGLGNQTCRTHTLFLLCLHSSLTESNKATLKFGKRLKNITNTMSEEVTLVQPAHSLHQAAERIQTKMKQKLASVHTPVSATPVAPRSEKMNNSESTVTPVTATRVRRQLFDSVPEMIAPIVSESIVPVAVENIASAIAAAESNEVITPKPTRRYAIVSAKATPSEETTTTPHQASTLESPSPSPSTRRWKIGNSASKALNGLNPGEARMGAILEDEETHEIVHPSPASTTAVDAPTPTRRWTFKPKSATSTPIVSIQTQSLAEVESTNKLATMKLAYEALEKRLAEALQLVETITKERQQSSRSVEEDAILMAREAVAMSECDLTRNELEALNQTMGEFEVMNGSVVEVGFLPIEEDDHREHSFILDEDRFFASPSPAASPSRPSMEPVPISPAQFQADEIRDAFSSMCDTPLRAPNMDGFSRLSIVNESIESQMSEEETNSSSEPYQTLPSFAALPVQPPSNSSTISVTSQDDSSTTETSTSSSDSIWPCTRLAELMRRSLGLPAYFSSLTRVQPSSASSSSTSSRSHARTHSFPASSLNIVNFQATSLDGGNFVEPDSRITELMTPLHVESTPATSTALVHADPIVNDTAALIAKAAALTAARNKQYAESSIWEKMGCEIM